VVKTDHVQQKSDWPVEPDKDLQRSINDQGQLGGGGLDSAYLRMIISGVVTVHQNEGERSTLVC
jgi:hypothetical protein